MSLTTPLPPRPRRREWALGGLAAGLLLGVFERALGLVEGAEVGPALAFALIGATALLVALPCTLVGLIPGLWLSQSGLVGVGVGAIVGARPLGTVLGAWLDQAPAEAALLGALPGLVLAAVVAVAAAWVAQRLERGQALPAPPLPVWGLVGFLVAASERRLAFGATFLDVATVLVAAIALAVLGVFALGATRMRVGPLGRTVAVGIVAAAALALGPQLGPWLWNAPRLDAPLPEAPSLLAVALPPMASQGASRVLPSVELLAASGLRFDAVEMPSSGRDSLQALFRLPDGSSLLAAMHARGYVSAAVLADPERPPPPGVRDVRVKGPLRSRLAHEAERSAGGPLVVLGGVGELLGADPIPEVTEEAIVWLLGWRSVSSPPPFILLVDFRREAAPVADDVQLDRELARLLDLLDEMGIGPRTQVIVVEPEGAGSRRMRAVIRPVGDGSVQAVRVREPVAIDRLAATLQRGAGLDAREPG